MERIRLPIRLRRLALLCALGLMHSPAYAYIDPNTGGFLFQLLAPLAALALSAWIFFTDHVKAAWRSLCGFLRRKAGRSSRE
jgi:hypothetical protein